MIDGMRRSRRAATRSPNSTQAFSQRIVEGQDHTRVAKCGPRFFCHGEQSAVLIREV